MSHWGLPNHFSNIPSSITKNRIILSQPSPPHSSQENDRLIPCSHGCEPGSWVIRATKTKVVEHPNMRPQLPRVSTISQAVDEVLRLSRAPQAVSIRGHITPVSRPKRLRGLVPSKPTLTQWYYPEIDASQGAKDRPKHKYRSNFYCHSTSNDHHGKDVGKWGSAASACYLQCHWTGEWLIVSNSKNWAPRCPLDGAGYLRYEHSPKGDQLVLVDTKVASV